jgi:hypothetical protein
MTNTSQKRILKEAPYSFKPVMKVCTRVIARGIQDSWRPTGCWINNNNYYYNENFI